MGQVKEEILGVYFENPGKEFTIREISSLAKVPRATVHKKLKELKQEKYFEDKLFFKVKKCNYYIEQIFSVGLINYLVKNLNPSCIILFGSFRKGESDKNSDIDIFVESSIKKEINLSGFEKKLKHKIDLFVKSNISNLQENLFNNVVNGIKLYGSLSVGKLK